MGDSRALLCHAKVVCVMRTSLSKRETGRDRERERESARPTPIPQSQSSWLAGHKFRLRCSGKREPGPDPEAGPDRPFCATPPYRNISQFWFRRSPLAGCPFNPTKPLPRPLHYCRTQSFTSAVFNSPNHTLGTLPWPLCGLLELRRCPASVLFDN